MNPTEGEKWLTRALILLPGFLSVGIARYVGGLGTLSDLELTLFSFAVSLVVFGLAMLFRCLYAAIRKLKNTNYQDPGTGVVPSPTVGYLGLVLLMACVVGYVMALGYQQDVLLRALRWFPGTTQVTKRSSDRPLNLLLRLNQQGALEDGRPTKIKRGEAWLDVTLDNNDRFLGHPKFFGLGMDETEIFLSPACTATGQVSMIEGPGIVIPQTRIRYVKFVDRSANRCYKLWEGVARSLEEGSASP